MNNKVNTVNIWIIGWRNKVIRQRRQRSFIHSRYLPEVSRVLLFTSGKTIDISYTFWYYREELSDLKCIVWYFAIVL